MADDNNFTRREIHQFLLLGAGLIGGTWALMNTEVAKNNNASRKQWIEEYGEGYVQHTTPGDSWLTLYDAGSKTSALNTIESVVKEIEKDYQAIKNGQHVTRTFTRKEENVTTHKLALVDAYLLDRLQEYYNTPYLDQSERERVQEIQGNYVLNRLLAEDHLILHKFGDFWVDLVDRKKESNHVGKGKENIYVDLKIHNHSGKIAGYRALDLSQQDVSLLGGNRTKALVPKKYHSLHQTQ